MSIILDGTTEVIEAKLSASPTTPLEVFAAFVTLTSSDVTPANTSTTLTNTSDTTVVGSPGASEQRQVKYVSIYNADNAAAAVTIKYDTSGTERRIGVWTLQPGESLMYGDGIGWYVLDTSGARKQASVLITPNDVPKRFPGVDAANLTAVKTLTSGSTFAAYMGRAERAYASIVLRYRVTTAAVTITWAEAAVATGPDLTMGGNASLTRVGFTDVSATINSTGIKSTTVNVSGFRPGDHLWALFGNQASTAAILRGALADDIQSGRFQAAGATRPSTMAAATAFTIEGATVVPPWGDWIGS